MPNIPHFYMTSEEFFDQLKERPEGLSGSDWPLPDLSKGSSNEQDVPLPDFEGHRLSLEPDFIWHYRKKFLAANYHYVEIPKLLLISQMYILAMVYNETFHPLVDDLISNMEANIRDSKPYDSAATQFAPEKSSSKKSHIFSKRLDAWLPFCLFATLRKRKNRYTTYRPFLKKIPLLVFNLLMHPG